VAGQRTGPVTIREYRRRNSHSAKPLRLTGLGSRVGCLRGSPLAVRGQARVLLLPSTALVALALTGC
jgi:hypothetical protein